MDLLLTALAVIGWTLLGLLALLLALLLLFIALPFHLRARAAVDSEQDEPRLPLGAMAWVRASWGWFVLAISWSSDTGGEVRVFGLRVARFPGEEDDPGEKKRKKEEKKAKKKEKEKSGKYGPRWAMRHRRTLLGILVRLLRALRLRLAVAGALGLGDPADTVLAAELLRFAEANLPGTALDIEIDYLDEVVVLAGAVSGRIWLLHLAGICLWELRRRDVRRMLAGR